MTTSVYWRSIYCTHSILYVYTYNLYA